MGLAGENQGVARAASLLQAPGEGLFSGLFRFPEVPASLGWRPRPPSSEVAMLTLSLASTFTALRTPSSLTKTSWPHWVPWQGPGKPLCPCLKILHLKKKKILHLLRRQSILPHKGKKPMGIGGRTGNSLRVVGATILPPHPSVYMSICFSIHPLSCHLSISTPLIHPSSQPASPEFIQLSFYPSVHPSLCLFCPPPPFI